VLLLWAERGLAHRGPDARIVNLGECGGRFRAGDKDSQRVKHTLPSQGLSGTGELNQNLQGPALGATCPVLCCSFWWDWVRCVRHEVIIVEESWQRLARWQQRESLASCRQGLRPAK
jgi:hypothetical protein